MTGQHGYGATLKNNQTEGEAILYVLSQNPCLRRPTTAERKAILTNFGLPHTFARAFDLVLMPAADIVDILSVPKEQLKLVELKTTKKKLVNLPEKFFFGATENEFQLAERLGDQYAFCFVSLHGESLSHVLITAKELESKIKTKRLQYQINLR